MNTKRWVPLLVLALLVALPATAHAQQAYYDYAQLQPQQALVAQAGYQAYVDPNVLLASGCQPCGAQCGGGCAGTGCGGGCYSQGCGCGSCGGGTCCNIPRFQVWGEYLYLRPRNAEVTYAIVCDPRVDPVPVVPVQAGPAGVLDYDYESAYRAGFAVKVSDCATVGVSYTNFFTEVWDSLEADFPYSTMSTVTHPSMTQGGLYGSSAAAQAQLDFELIDLDFRQVFSSSCRHSATWLVGGRYANLNQEFYSIHQVDGYELVQTDIDFEGGGIRVGLEVEGYGTGCGWMVYGKGGASFVAGEFKARYVNYNSPSGTVVLSTWEAGRIVPMLDLEVGVGWNSPSGCLRLTAGYMVSAWYNTVKTDEFIQAVQGNNFVGLGDVLTFDGLTARAEVRY